MTDISVFLGIKGEFNRVEAYSRLKFLLDERRLTRAELLRQIGERERSFNVKTLYRLADPDRPLERVDLRLAGAVCRALGIGLGDLITFSDPDQTRLQTLDSGKQARLQELMDRHNEGELADGELEELRALVVEAESLSLANARRLVEHRRRLAKPGPGKRPASAI